MLTGLGLILVLVTNKECGAIVIGLDCSEHSPRVEVRYVGTGGDGRGLEKRESENNSQVFASSEWVGTNAVWEILTEKQVGGGGWNHKHCLGYASFEMPIRYTNEVAM